jgi:hypothetical protein
MPLLIPVLSRLGVAPRFLRPAAWAVAAGVALALLAAAVCLIRRDAVDDHHLEQIDDVLSYSIGGGVPRRSQFEEVLSCRS